MAKKQKKRDTAPAQPQPTAGQSPSRQRAAIIAVSIALVVAVFAVYGQTHSFSFIAYDDDAYVYRNDVVKQGLTGHGVLWALEAYCCANWHPVTMLSHMLDSSLFGEGPGPRHLVNAAFHAANAVLLFLAFARMTGALWRSAFVAAFFALHPLHVESVAWIAERKDVLSTFFALVALLFYMAYVRKPGPLRYAAVAFVFALGLMAKSMLVTLPLVFLLLDAWPLKRLRWPLDRAAVRVIAEKMPLLAMSAAVSVATIAAQRAGGAVKELQSLPVSYRLENAVVAYASYIYKTFWPAKLAVLYPYEAQPVAAVVVAAILLAAISAAAVLFAAKKPYILVGWLWYLGMLVPVIGLVQVGAQSMADRYTYLPLVGLSVAVVWPLADLVGGRPAVARAAAIAACAVLAALAVAACIQTGYWASSTELFERTIAVTNRNHIIWNNLGVALLDEKKYDEAVAAYKKALEIAPDYADAHANVGHLLLAIGRLDEARAELARALELKPRFMEARTDMGTVLAAQGKYEESVKEFEQSLAISPAQPEVQSNLAFVLTRLGRLDEAISHCREALRAKPDFIDARYNLGVALLGKGDKAGAAAEFSRVLAAAPDNAAAREGLAAAQAL